MSAKLTDLPTVASILDADLFYIVSGGTSYAISAQNLRASMGNIAGTVANYNALPISVGSPPVGTRYIVENDQGSYFTFNKKPAGLYERFTNTGALIDWSRLGDFTLVPFRDDQYFYDSVDGTKKLQFELSGISTATTRVAAWPDKNGTVAMIDDTVINALIFG